MAALACEGATEYLDLTLRALDARVITTFEAMARIRVLRSLASDGDLPRWREPDAVGDAEDDTLDGTIEGESVEGSCAAAATPRAPGVPRLHLLLAPSTGLADWEVHKGDPDPLPSVPHAHHRNHQQKKLDLYRGFIHLGNRRIDRVAKRELVLLWNDAAFRAFAREALEHFIAVNPRFKFRVTNPLRLPRRRRS
jgi:hypothetical protein